MTRTITGAGLADAALSLLGAPFRLHGRDPTNGLDCVGLLEAALALCGATVRLPNAYALRSRRLPDLSGLAERAGLSETSGIMEGGDVLLLRPSACQHHLAIATSRNRIVHAHAGLRRVVHSPLPDGWPLAGHWRLQRKRS